ncbi:hypothetical protein FOMPIDRAFT_1056932 [Fomitopsis schrenkii]|uniref:Uncharacterized protein n=1 Tax=Fomitopsis schrenkii TaxID=2126942 RepID=S8ESI4_FOMSC|nr:hypothetical protein FOMPIDRAFT_1056932 [Fomitopsis schrenkii]
MALSLGSGGAFEVLSMVLHVFAALTVFARMIHMFRVKDQGTRGCLFMDGSIWSLCLMASLIMTIRAARNSGLAHDYSALTVADARSAATAVLALSWLAFSLASFEIILDLVQPHPPAKITPYMPYTNGPPRHRVVFHENHRPLKIIDIPQNTDPYYWKQKPSKERYASSKSQYPTVPRPTYARPSHKQPVRMDESWSMA